MILHSSTSNECFASRCTGMVCLIHITYIHAHDNASCVMTLSTSPCTATATVFCCYWSFCLRLSLLVLRACSSAAGGGGEVVGAT